MRLAASAAARAGLASLRIGMRGSGVADGTDLYHAGLTADLHQALSHPPLKTASAIFLVGYSLGGHIVLRAATEPQLDGRVRAVAAICPPLDLSKTVQAIDAPASWIYRHYVLAALKRQYLAFARRRGPLAPTARVLALRRLRDWDDLLVARRFGFASADDYYRRASVAPVIDRIARPALILSSELDPMIPPWTAEAALARAPTTVDAHLLRAGWTRLLPSPSGQGPRHRQGRHRRRRHRLAAHPTIAHTTRAPAAALRAAPSG